jgi:hypothetical protein
MTITTKFPALALMSVSISAATMWPILAAPSFSEEQRLQNEQVAFDTLEDKNFKNRTYLAHRPPPPPPIMYCRDSSWRNSVQNEELLKRP